MFDYFYGQSGEMFSYFRVPKILFRDIKFKDLSTDAKTLYGILLDRMGLSVKNGWLDEQGRVYIIFPVQEVMDALGCADNKATKLFRELEKFGLIERKRRGLGKPNLIYVKNFADPRCRNRGKNDSGNADSEVQDAAAFLGVLALVGLTAGGGIYAFMKQKQKKQPLTPMQITPRTRAILRFPLRMSRRNPARRITQKNNFTGGVCRLTY
mgnify:CR=1 FL=1